MRRSDGSAANPYNSQLLRRTRVGLYFRVLIRYFNIGIGKFKKKRQRRPSGFKKRRIRYYEKRRRLRSSGN
jgi:hypothetical protein